MCIRVHLLPLLQVDVLNVNTGEQNSFYYNGWLAKDEPPYITEVELSPGGEDMPMCRQVLQAALLWLGRDNLVHLYAHTDARTVAHLSLCEFTTVFWRGRECVLVVAFP